MHVDSQGQELAQSFLNSSIPPFVEELLVFKVNPAEILVRVLVNFCTSKIMHLIKWRSFLTLVKEKEVNPVIKQNVYILITQFFYRLEKFQTITKLEQFEN